MKLLRVLDAVAAAFIGAPLVLAMLVRSLIPLRPRRGVGRRALVMDTAYSMHAVRQRRLERAITCRDLGGYFERVWTIHPLVGAALDEPRRSAFGRPEEVALDPTHSVLEGHAGRYAWLASLPRCNFALAQWSLVWRLDSLVRREGIRVIRVGDAYYQGLIGWWLARSNAIPFLVRVSGNDDAVFAMTGRRAYPRLFPSRSAEKRVARFVLSRADIVAGPNRDNLEAALGNGARPDRAVIFRYGNLVHPAHFVPPQEREGKESARADMGLPGCRILLYVGRLEPVKHSMDLVEILARVRRDSPDAGLAIAGDGSLRAPMESRARELGIHDAISFLGNRDQSWISRAAPTASVVVAPHMGRALVETALAGVPIVAYDIDWHSELVKEGENGHLVPLGEIDAFAKRVHGLLHDAPLAAKLGVQARESALDMMDPARLDANERATYARMLGEVT